MVVMAMGDDATVTVPTDADDAGDGRHNDEREVERSGGRYDGVDAVDVQSAVGRNVRVESDGRAIGEPAGVARPYRDRPPPRARFSPAVEWTSRRRSARTRWPRCRPRRRR